MVRCAHRPLTPSPSPRWGEGSKAALHQHEPLAPLGRGVGVRGAAPAACLPRQREALHGSLRSRPLIPGPSPCWGEGSSTAPHQREPLPPVVRRGWVRGRRDSTALHQCAPLAPLGRGVGVRGRRAGIAERAWLAALPPPHPQPFSPRGRREYTGAVPK